MPPCSTLFFDHFSGYWLQNVCPIPFFSSIYYCSDIGISFASVEEPLENEKLLQFLQHNKFPLVTTLTELNSVKVYSSEIKLQVSFHSFSYLPCF